MPIGGAGHSDDHAPGAKPWRLATELRTLIAAYPLCGSALTDTMDNPSEECPTKLIDTHSHPKKIPVLYNQSYTT